MKDVRESWGIVQADGTPATNAAFLSRAAAERQIAAWQERQARGERPDVDARNLRAIQTVTEQQARDEQVIRDYLWSVWGNRRMVHVCEYTDEIARELAERLAGDRSQRSTA